jgi:glycosyltransferase involved in cell wall biosynthesis/SAM-dependent methyltransferase
MRPRTTGNGVLWMTTRCDTRGGVGSYLRTIEATPLWAEWSIELVSTHRDGSALAKIGEFGRGIALLLRRIAVNRPALVHLHMASYGSFARKSVIVAICRAVGIPVVLHIHGGEFERFFRRAAPPVRALIRATLAGSAVVVALGNQWAARLKEIVPGARVEVIPNAVHVTGAGRNGRSAGPVQVVFLGDVRDHKGVFDLLQAWPHVGIADGLAQLVIVGSGELERAQTLIDDLAISASVRLTGWLAPERVPALLTASDVLVLPSWHEGQPMAVLEAMGRGLCIVATDVGGIPDLLEDGTSGILVPPSDIEALSTALRKVITDAEVRHRLATGAFARARSEFNIDIVWRQIDALYRDVLSARRRPTTRSGDIAPSFTVTAPEIGKSVGNRTSPPQLRSETADVELFESHIRSRVVSGRPVEILEAGCGRRWSLAMEGIEFRLTGVDMDRAALEIRRDVQRDMDVAIVGDLATADLPDGFFDVVYNSFVMEHVQDADRVLGNFARWLRPGGVLLLRFPDRRSVRGFVTRFSPHCLHVLYYRRVLKFPGAGQPGFPPYPVIYHPTVSRAGIRRFCRDNALRLREEWGDGQHLLLGGGITERLSKLVMRIVAILTIGRLTAAHTNLLYVIEKPDSSDSAIVAGAQAQENHEPVKLDVVLDTVGVGGAEVQLLELFRAMDPDKVIPRLVCLRDAGPLAEEFRLAGFEVEILPRAARLDPRRLTRLVGELRRHRTDVVLVVHFQRAALALGRVAARLAGIADVVAVHDMDLTSVGGRCLPRHVVESLFLSSALVLLAPSQGHYLHAQEGVARFPWRRVDEVVIPNGIRLPDPPTEPDRRAARAALGLSAEDVVVGIVARLTEQKAHHVLLAAIARLVPAHPRLRLVVIGGGPREAELRTLATQLGIADRVLFTGLRRDVPDLLAAFDLTALSSVHEGAPVSVIESMAAQLPVVVTDCGALRDMVTDGDEGYLVPVRDVVALADRIGALAADPGLRASMGERGRRRAEQEFRIDDTAASYERLLVELADR